MLAFRSLAQTLMIIIAGMERKLLILMQVYMVLEVISHQLFLFEYSISCRDSFLQKSTRREGHMCSTGRSVLLRPVWYAVW